MVGEKRLLYEGKQKVLGLLSIPTAEGEGLIGARSLQHLSNLMCHQVGEECSGLDAAEVSDARTLAGESLCHECQDAAGPPSCHIVQGLAQEGAESSNFAIEDFDESVTGAHPRDGLRGLLHQLGVL
jgi:hypothetical protein